MTKTATKILILLGALALLIAGVTAAPSYQIETGNLAKDNAGVNNGYYILNGYNLTLPLNITYISETQISSLIANTTVTQGNTWIDNLGYGYTLNSTIPGGFAGATFEKEWQYQIATGKDGGINGTMPDALTINITSLLYSEDSYNVTISILAADLNAESQDLGTTIISLDKGVKVYYLYQEDNSTNEADWSMTIPLNATANFLTGKDVPVATTLTIPWDNVTVTRGVNSLNITDFTVWKLVNNEWVAASSSVVALGDQTLSVTIGYGDGGAEDYKLLFEGRVLGDVSGIGNDSYGAVNIVDVDAMLQYATAKDKSKIIADNWFIYGDITGDGAIYSNDAVAAYNYFINGIEYDPATT